MTEQITNVEDSELKFKLPADNVFPVELFEGKSFEEIKEILQDFITIQDKDVYTERILTPEEISEIRRVYGEIAEDKLPVLREELDALIAEHKQKKELMQDRITALNTQFSDLVHQAKQGAEDYHPIADRTFRIPISGHYLTYTFTGTKFQLARVQRIPDSQRYDLFNSSDKNKENFQSFGYDFPDNPILNKQNYRVINSDFSGEEYVEVWEENGKDVGFNHWKEDILDEDTGELVTLDRKERIEIPIEESPYQNEIKAQEGTTDDISEVVAEELQMGAGKTSSKNKG